MQYGKLILEYISKNEIGIDKSIYITAFLSILMIYGIFLSFLQFASKDYTNTKEYMGLDLFVHGLINKNRYIEILGSYKFVVLFAVSIILPIIESVIGIYNGVVILKNVLILTWILINIVIAIIFIMAFVKCSKLILTKMYNGEERILKKESYLYNQKIINKYSNGKEMTVDTMYHIINVISKKWDADRFNYDDDYFELELQILKIYLRLKKIDYNKIEKGKRVKRQDAFLSNLNKEFDAINQIFKIIIDKGYSFEMYLQLIPVRNNIVKYGFKSFAAKENEREDRYYKSEMEKYINSYFSIYKKIMDYDEKNIDKYEFQTLLFNDIEELGKLDFGSMISTTSINEGWWILRNILEKIMKSEENLKINSLFYRIQENPKLMRNFLEWLAAYAEDNIIKIDKLSDIINMLSNVEKAYLFLHIFFYYSMYNFRFSWNKFDVKFIRLLVPSKDFLLEVIKNNEDDLLAQLPVPMNMHRFREFMFKSLKEYLNENIDFEHLNLVRMEKSIDYKYYFVIRTICWSEYESYTSYKIENPEIRKEILHFISLHYEFFTNEKFKSFLYNIRKDAYSTIDLNNERFNYNFEELIIADFKIDPEELCELIENNSYIPEALIKYILIKYLKNEIKCEDIWIKKEVIYYIENSLLDANKYVQEILNTFEKYDLSLSSWDQKLLMSFVENLYTEKDTIKMKN